MKFKYYGRFMDVTENMRAYAEKKITKLDWFFGDDAEAQVKFAIEKGGRNIVEITINHRNMLFRAEESTEDMYASIDSAVDKLGVQIRRHRSKLEKKFRGHTEEPIPAPSPEEEEAERSVVKVKRFSVKPMTVEDAVTQMEQLGHTFYVFDNAETDSVCVLYLRKDGDYGLLQPEK